MLGTVYVGFCLLLSLLGYLVAPDGSTHANFQVLELAKSSPGTQVPLLMRPQPGAEPGSLWRQFWRGRRQTHLPIALASDPRLELSDTRVRFTRYAGVRDSLPLTAFEEDFQGDMAAFADAHLQTIQYRLGSDSYGRDLLSRIILGARVSLAVGLLSVLISLSIGVLMGIVAGYVGGWVDRLIMWLVSVLWSIPTLLLALALAAVLGRGFWQLFVAIGVSMWVEVARLVRGQVLALKEQPFIEASRALGYPAGRVMRKHLLPNVASPIIVIAVANFGAAVLIESGLSFLGLGVEVPIPTWGRMINEGYTYLVFEAGQWMAIYPGLALVLLIMSINLMGIGLRDALDVNLKSA